VGLFLHIPRRRGLSVQACEAARITLENGNTTRSGHRGSYLGTGLTRLLDEHLLEVVGGRGSMEATGYALRRRFPS
jgi:hypothetical protein